MKGHFRAHPRACGENFSRPVGHHRDSGSSPRMRGKQVTRPDGHTASGLIPAHAGKTYPHPGPASKRKAHPRACGENLIAVWTAWIAPGSSPRMRGKRAGRQSYRPGHGLIPAHAGKTKTHLILPKELQAHPRACGENLFIDGDGVRLEGSSPRMRGKRMFSSWSCTTGGLIPAHAGKTLNDLEF